MWEYSEGHARQDPASFVSEGNPQASSEDPEDQVLVKLELGFTKLGLASCILNILEDEGNSPEQVKTWHQEISQLDDNNRGLSFRTTCEVLPTESGRGDCISDVHDKETELLTDEQNSPARSANDGTKSITRMVSSKQSSETAEPGMSCATVNSLESSRKRSQVDSAVYSLSPKDRIMSPGAEDFLTSEVWSPPLILSPDKLNDMTFPRPGSLTPKQNSKSRSQSTGSPNSVYLSPKQSAGTLVEETVFPGSSGDMPTTTPYKSPRQSAVSSSETAFARSSLNKTSSKQGTVTPPVQHISRRQSALERVKEKESGKCSSADTDQFTILKLKSRPPVATQSKNKPTAGQVTPTPVPVDTVMIPKKVIERSASCKPAAKTHPAVVGRGRLTSKQETPMKPQQWTRLYVQPTKPISASVKQEPAPIPTPFRANKVPNMKKVWKPKIQSQAQTMELTSASNRSCSLDRKKVAFGSALPRFSGDTKGKGDTKSEPEAEPPVKMNKQTVVKKVVRRKDMEDPELLWNTFFEKARENLAPLTYEELSLLHAMCAANYRRFVEDIRSQFNQNQQAD